MKSITFDFDIDSLRLHRLFRRGSIDLTVTILKIVLAVLIFVLFVLLVYRAVQSIFDAGSVISKLESDVKSLPTRIVPVRKDKDKARDYSLIVSSKVFGELGVKATPAPAAPVKPVSQLALELIGTFIDRGKQPYAIIEDKKKKSQDVFVVNDMVFDEAKLKSIHPDRVEIERNGQIEILRLDDTPESSVETKDGIGVIGENQYVVEEAEVDKALENLPLLLTQARAVPYFKDGKAIGLRMFAIRTGSLYEKIGLKNGDILKSINGNSLGDLSQAMKLFEKLKEEKSLGLTLERNNEDKEFRYQVK